MTTFNDVMNANVRTIYGKVEITYTGPFLQEDTEVIVESTNNGTRPRDLIDGVERPAFRWFSLHENRLDGSYHPIDTTGQYEVGWWDTKLSDPDGVLPTPTVVKIEFETRTLVSLRFVGDSILEVFPVDFVLKIFDNEEILLHSITVTGNNNVVWETTLDPFIQGANSFVLTVTRINKPNQVLRLLELFTSVVETYEDSLLQSMSLLEEVGYRTGQIPLGNISSNELMVALNNIDRRFDLNNSSSKLYTYIRKNRRVKAWIGADVNNVRHWEPLGTFWTVSWDVPNDTLFASLIARDRMELLRLSDFKGTPVLTDINVYDLFELVLQDAGLRQEQYQIDEELRNILVPYAWFDRSSHKEALARIASFVLFQVFCTREDVVKVNRNLIDVGSMRFNGVTTLLPIPAISFTSIDAITIELWAKIELDIVANAMLFCFPNPGSGATNIVILPSGTIRVVSSGAAPIGYNYTITEGWHHIAVVRDEGTLVLFIDGEEQTPISTHNSINSTSSFIIGGTSSSLRFKGLVNEFRFWDYVRSEEQIREGMFEELSKDTPGLLRYYLFNDRGIDSTEVTYLNKLQGNLAVNPNFALKYEQVLVQNPSIPPTPPVWANEISSSDYELISLRDNRTYIHSFTPTQPGGMMGTMFYFNIVDEVRRKYGDSVFQGASTTASRMAWLRANAKSIVLNLRARGYRVLAGGGMLGMSVILDSFSRTPPQWIIQTSSSASNNFSIITFAMNTTNIRNNYMHDDGFIYFLARINLGATTNAEFRVEIDDISLSIDFNNIVKDNGTEGLDASPSFPFYSSEVPIKYHLYDADINMYSAKFPLAVTDQINAVEVESASYTPEPDVTVYDGDEELQLGPGERTTVTYGFSQTPVIDLTSDDFQFNGGSIVIENMVIYSWGAEITYYNTGNTTGSVTHITLIGTALKKKSTQIALAEDAKLIRDDGRISARVSHDFIQTPRYANILAEAILHNFRRARRDITIHARGNPAVRLSDIVLYKDPVTEEVFSYQVTRQKIDFDGGLEATVEAKLTDGVDN